MYIDTHTHLYDEQFTGDDAIARAIAEGVNKMYMPNCDSTTAPDMLQIADAWPQNCFPMMGVHPCYIKENYKEELARAEKYLAERKYYAIGEIGLDYYWDLTFKPQQIEAFNLQIDWALQYGLPIVIHSRESTPDCINIVAAKQKGNLRGIFHCFSGTVEEAQRIVDLGLYLGIGGVVTYKKSTLPDVIKAISLDHLVLETDAPYLSPVPYRGKRNESSYIPIIAAKVAELKKISLEEVADVTTHNAGAIFNS